MHVGGEKGYPLFFFSKTRAWTINVVFGLLVIVLCSGLYIWYSSVSNDPTPDSIVGFGYAFAGTTFLILAAVMYSLQRRARHRAIGQLHAALSWHVCFGVVGLALLFMHSFGNFNPRSGTFALYGLIALVISGLVGRLLDRAIPHLMAQEVNKMLTANGEDRIETLSQKLQAIVQHNAEEVRSIATPTKDAVPPIPTDKPSSPRDAVPPVPTDKPSSPRQRTTTSLVPRQSSSPKGLPFSITGHGLHTSWDLAYISVEQTPQELIRNSQQSRFVPDKKSALARPEALMPGAQEHISALKSMQQAMQRELFYRYVIRYWRVLHVSLALLTVGLLLWHIVYALQLLLPTLLH